MEKRDLKRIPVNLDASLHFNGISCDAFIGNISEKGLHTIVTNPTGAELLSHKETDVLLSFNTPSGEVIKLHCKKKWSYKPSDHNRTMRVGLELLNDQPEYTTFYQNKYYEIRNNLSRNAIAVVGMACYYPGAPDLHTFWENILARRREFRRMPDERMPLSEYYDPDPAVPDKTYATKAAVIDGFEFDWAKRGIPKSVIESSDIAHWLALEISLRALENAGYSRKTVPTDRSGVVLGNTLTGEHSRSENMRLRWPFVRKALITAASQKGLPAPLIDELAKSMEGYYKSVFAPVTEDTLAGNLSNTIAGRICNFLNFNGGGYTVDGACSSSLIAVTTAATALSNGNMDLVIAGGVDISLDTFELVGFAKTNALTKEDMRVYDRRASGFIPGEGAGFVVLKRLEDARAHGNYIYSVLRGWGISSDGKGGLTAPKAETQAIAIRRAYTQAGYTPKDVDFIEGHGTGTPAGDKAELEAISEAMDEMDNEGLRSCGITSLKSIIGHTKAASGIGGFIKASLAVNRRILPPTAGCTERNTVFDEKAFSLYPILHGEVRSQKDIIRAGVSGMGFGGINCHVTLESGDEPAKNLEPSIAESKLLVSPQDTELFVFSADSPEKMIRKLRAIAKTAADISVGEMVDLARHLTDKVAVHEDTRVSIIAATSQDLQHGLERCAQMLQGQGPPPGKIQSSVQQDIWIGNAAHSSNVGFLFPGQGSQQLNMGRLLVERYSWARDLVDRADEWLRGAGAEAVSKFIYQPVDRAPGSKLLREWHNELTRSDIAQPAICLNSLLWLHYLERLGICPVASGGHSLGELMAFHAAGVMSAEEMLWLAALRGQAMTNEAKSGSGTMASFACDCRTLENIIKQVEGYGVVANINSPSQTVMSGESTAVEQAMHFAERMDIKTKRLPVANAFHSRFVTDAAEQLRKKADIPEMLKKNGVKLFSSIDGAEVPVDTNLRDHFARQVTAQVNFISLIENMKTRCDLMLEVGPGRILTGLAQAITGPDGIPCFPVESKATEWSSLNIFLGAYFVHGGEIKWPVLYEDRLIRPFIPPAERKFIDNPCERSFDLAKTPELTHYADHTSSNHLILPENTIGLFSSQQENFIRNLIRSEMKNYQNDQHRSPDAHTPGTADAVPILPQGGREEASGNQTYQGKSPEVILELAAEMTGFPKESISLDYRLLDNLNLDSIKAGQFVAKAAKLFEVEGKLDPTTMANSSLLEIYEAIANVSSPKTIIKTEPVLPPAEPERLLKLASEITGFPMESITLKKRLLDDLNLDSIKAGQFVAKAAKLFEVEGKLDPTTMANSSIQEVYDEIRAHLPAAPVEPKPSAYSSKPQKNFSQSPTGENDNWVRNFRITYKEQKVTSQTSIAEVLSRLSSQNRKIFIFTDDSTAHFPKDILTVLSEHGINAIIKEYAQVEETEWHDYGNISVCIYLMPIHDERGIPSRRHAMNMTRRLHSIGTVISALKEQGIKAYQTVLQFGDGNIFNSTRDNSLSFEAKGCASFLASLHLENPGQKFRLLEFGSQVDAAVLLHKVTEELAQEDAFIIAGYDRDNVRRIPMLEPAKSWKFKKRGFHWSHDDVILVTGGAKGITAECALSFAQQTGVKLALVGRTPLINRNPEMQEILKRYRESNITYRYYACDISDATCVNDLVGQIEQDLGAVTGVFHGAAVNKPRRVEQASLASVLDEISPKLLGAINICNTLRGKPPKLLVGLSSIIGVTGMMGNAWYGFANEAMSLLLQEFASLTDDKTKVISLAYSVWGETGMGVKLSVVKNFQSMGILAIPTKGGTERFMQLVMNDPGEQQMVISSRLSGLDTPLKDPIPETGGARFLEEILSYEKGVELEAKAVLTLTKDPYLKDHLFNSTYLFPTVFGLEAMMQAVVYVTGNQDIEQLCLENVNLSYPITVDPDDETEIHIRALIEDPTDKEDITRVKVGISVDQTGFVKNHFEAIYVLRTPAPDEKYGGKIPESVLDIQPKEDLYGHMLFQGEMFQQVQSVRLLEETGCIFDSVQQSPLTDSEDFMPKFYAGDPFFRDTLLQSIQVFLPDVVALPIEIEKWEFFQLNTAANQVNTVKARLTKRSTEMLLAEVTAIDPDGRIIEKLHGYKAKIIEQKKNAPQAHDIVNPDQWDEKQINEMLHLYSQEINAVPPVVALKHQPGFHDLKKTKRHSIEETLFARAYAKFRQNDAMLPANITVAWSDAGRPVLKETNDAGISCSHDDRLCICSVGWKNQGCDLETVIHQSKEEWLNLLGMEREPLLKDCADLDKSMDLAGTRIWCALEALRKATDMQENNIEQLEKVEECIIFKAGDMSILTFPVKLLRGRERILAFTVTSKENLKKHERQQVNRNIQRTGMLRESFIYDERVKQKVFACQLPISLRDNATIGGGVYFANYLHWLGKVREMSLKPIGEYIADEFFNGHFMVTNHSKVDILSHVRNHDDLEARLWIDRIFGNKNSSLVLKCEWRKRLADGDTKMVAFGEQQATWVKVIGHGIVEPVDCPRFFQNYLEDNGFMPNKNSESIAAKDIKFENSNLASLGGLIHETKVGINGTASLSAMNFDTSMENSNLAQNIYFSNYFIWQGHLRDRYFFDISPENYRRMNGNGQLLCLQSSVKHLREAMPFDRIRTTMYLKKLHDCGLELYFEYHKTDQSGKQEKIAFGDHTLAWVHVDSTGNYKLGELPDLYVQPMLKAYGVGHG